MRGEQVPDAVGTRNQLTVTIQPARILSVSAWEIAGTIIRNREFRRNSRSPLKRSFTHSCRGIRTDRHRWLRSCRSWVRGGGPCVKHVRKSIGTRMPHPWRTTAGSWWAAWQRLSPRRWWGPQPEKTRCTTSRPAATSPMAVTNFPANSLSATCQCALMGGAR